MTIILIVAVGLALGSIQRADSHKGWSYAVMAFTLIIVIKSIPITTLVWSIYEWSIVGVILAAFVLVYYLIDRFTARVRPA